MKTWKPLSDEIIASSIFKFGADIWARSGFKCEYCSFDILSSPQTYRYAQSDHILPVSKYEQYANDPNNYAHTCGLCNQLKRNTDPLEDNSLEIDLTQSITLEQRDKLIAICSDRLHSLIAQVEQDVRELTILRDNHLKRHNGG